MGGRGRRQPVEAESSQWRQKTASRACRGRNLVAETESGWWGRPKTSLGGPKMSNAA